MFQHHSSCHNKPEQEDTPDSSLMALPVAVAQPTFSSSPKELRLSSQAVWSAALATAPAWGQLPQLCELKVDRSEAHTTGRELAAVIAGVAAATALTGLELQMFQVESPGGEDAGHEEQAAVGVRGGRQQVALNISASIAGLTRLQDLDVAGLDNSLSVAANDEVTAAFVDDFVLNAAWSSSSGWRPLGRVYAFSSSFDIGDS
ncbi:hypothetical protein OEZ85_005542 [Tetradesmus obliquus]|uniref:Uncharacterized protein n=1 Tax=Tetradesmus obliquus TaxID=3088 RepID=A0ABY8UE09_TETOB|nr:hypothetical protein OEZ85_005542 [Tetradesmus obliquus]